MAEAGVEEDDAVQKAKAALLSGIEDAQKTLLERLRATGFTLDLPLPEPEPAPAPATTRPAAAAAPAAAGGAGANGAASAKDSAAPGGFGGGLGSSVPGLGALEGAAGRPPVLGAAALTGALSSACAAGAYPPALRLLGAGGGLGRSALGAGAAALGGASLGGGAGRGLTQPGGAQAFPRISLPGAANGAAAAAGGAAAAGAGAAAKDAGAAGDGEPAKKTVLEILADAASKEEEAKKDNRGSVQEVTKKKPVQPISGYARASTMHRQLDEATKPAGGQDAAAGQSQTDGAQTGENSEDAIRRCRVYFANVPRGTGEGLIRVKAERFGDVVRLDCHTDPVEIFGASWAMVTYSEPSMAEAAVKRMSKQPLLFGSAGPEPMEVRLATEEDCRQLQASDQAAAQEAEQMEHASEPPTFLSSLGGLYGGGLAMDGDGGRGRRRRDQAMMMDARSRSRRRRSRDRRRKRRQHSEDSQDPMAAEAAAGQAQLALALRRESSMEAANRRARLSKLGGFDNGSQQSVSSRGGGEICATSTPTGGRQIGVRGEWAQFAVSNGRHYYKNLLTGEARWDMPTGFMHMSTKMTNRESLGATPNRAKVFVSHIPADWGEAELTHRFFQFGQIAHVTVLRDDNGASRYCGFVAFMEEASAVAAINSMDGYFVGGQKLRVVQSRSA
eukprot:TRINITY_DN13033_c0_g1_i1.p1 TRINITY_DN13033_c0_g1~~TRINITY_DN13033_c0_g1_i1.p1  ORF type:complete len:697 (-),score=161.33 TRINITY_DN13033_c0_g1_i1:152-2167(-)